MTVKTESSGTATNICENTSHSTCMYLLFKMNLMACFTVRMFIKFDGYNYQRLLLGTT